MAWDDPSPRARTRTAPANPAAQPGYDAPVSAGRLLWCLVQTGLVALVAAVGVHGGLVRWHGHAGRGSAADLVLAAVAGLIVAMLMWRTVSRRPGGAGWVQSFWRPRFPTDRYSGTAYTDIVVAEAVADVVTDVIDALID